MIMIITYSKRLKAYVAETRNTTGHKQMIAVKSTRIEALVHGLQRLAYIKK